MRRDIDFVIRGGRLIDGTGAEPLEADIEFRQLTLKPSIVPSASGLVWAWPSDDYEPPLFEWKADPKTNAGKNQPDLVGGQSVHVTDSGQRVLKVHDTVKNWNHHPDWSIARVLFKSSTLKVGDEVIVTLMARSDKDADVEIVGDGSKLDAQGSRVWARAFPTARRRLSSPLWREIVLSSVVEPTQGGQDPAASGVSAYVRYKTNGSVWIRRVALYRRAAAAGAATGDGSP